MSGYLNAARDVAPGEVMAKELAGLRQQQMPRMIDRIPVLGNFDGWFGHIANLRAEGEMSLQAARERADNALAEVASLERMLAALNEADKAAQAVLQGPMPNVAAQVRR